MTNKNYQRKYKKSSQKYLFLRTYCPRLRHHFTSQSAVTFIILLLTSFKNDVSKTINFSYVIFSSELRNLLPETVFMIRN